VNEGFGLLIYKFADGFAGGRKIILKSSVGFSVEVFIEEFSFLFFSLGTN